MRSYLICDDQFTETPHWLPNCWVNVECPDEDDFHFLTGRLHIPEQMLAYAADPDERPRIERDGNWVMTILRIPAKDDATDEPVTTVPISIIMNGDVRVTICYHITELIPDFINYCRARHISAQANSSFILHIIYSGSFWFLKYLKEIQLSVTQAESQLARSIRNEDLFMLMNNQKSLVFFNTSLRGNEVLISRLRHVFTDDFDMDLLEDVEIELKQALNTVTIYTEILDTTLDTYASVISNNVNQIMKRMTGTTIVLMIPTLVASFYGMNVGISLSTNPHAFWIIVGIAALLTLGVTWLLRRIKWF